MRDSDTQAEAARQLISIVVPVYNEEQTVSAFYERVSRVAASLPDYDFEFVFTDNHSEDRTYSLLSGLAATDARVRVFRFSRNFGFQRSILTGYMHARGDAAVQLDCDLQDPPELISTFIDHWKRGADVVYGVRAERQESWLLSSSRALFYWLIDQLSEDHLPRDAGDFRLISRRVIDIVAGLQDARPYLRGTIASLGFEQVGIPYARDVRRGGESKFPVTKLLSLAVDGILNHSTVPLRLSTYFGLGMSALTFAGVVIYAFVKLATHAAWPTGSTMLAVLLLGGISVNAMLLGIIGEYLGRIYHQTRNRPLTIIERSIDAAANRPGPAATAAASATAEARSIASATTCGGA